MDNKATAGIRKRNQIKQANKAMFLWVAGMSVVVGVSIVLIVFLVQKIWFGEKVLYEKGKTVGVLEKNLKVVDSLRDNVRVLNSNQALLSTQLDGGSPLQSVLDALPADANSAAFASSLQTKLLVGIPGVTIETINVVPVEGVETTTDAGSSDTQAGEIEFNFSVSTDSNNYSTLKQVLERLEKSIRPINIKTLEVESQGKRIVLTATGVTYYDPAKTVQLKNKVVKP